MTNSKEYCPIGVFDSGYGGLTILRAIRERLPGYDYLYLGDNARAPYGTRSFDIVYQFTLEAVRSLFDRGCKLVILACNTASAKALRTIQQNDLPKIDPTRRVLGVIRPTAETVVESSGGHVGVMATPGTVNSRSYILEINKLAPEFRVSQQACPMWVPIVENGEAMGEGADWFVSKYVDQLMAQDPALDTAVLACTHYPLLYEKIRTRMPVGVRILTQGEIVADSLADYLERHQELSQKCSRGGSCRFLTTENPEKFDTLASMFLNHTIEAEKIALP